MVAPVHLLLGLLQEENHQGAFILAALGVDQEALRRKIEAGMPPEVETGAKDMTLTPCAKRVIDQAYDEARRLGDRHIGTEHLLLGLLGERGELPSEILKEAGVDLDSARRETSLNQEAAKIRESTSGAEDSRTFDSDTRRVLRIAWKMAQKDGQREIALHHLLFALLAEPSGGVARTLEDNGIDVARLCRNLEM